MGEVYAKVEITVPRDVVYQFLKLSYMDGRYLDAQKDARGYISNIVMTEEQEGAKLAFAVAGRDSATGAKVGGWTWGYIIEEISAGQTRINIRYDWGMSMTLLGLGTIGPQAANQVCGGVRGLLALEAGYLAGRNNSGPAAPNPV